MEDNKKTFTSRIDSDLYWDFKKICADNREKINEVLEKLMRKYIKQSKDG